MRKTVLYLVACLLLSPTPANAAEVALSLPKLQKRLQPAQLTVNDPVYRTRKTYEGFWLHDVLKLEGVLEHPGDELVLKCADGYAPTLPWKQIRKGHGLLAFREVGRAEGWEKFQQGKKTITPAPFYLIWAEADSSLPWPYQVVSVSAVSFEQKYGEIFPKDLPANHAVRRGFEVYRKECSKCHSINLRGGELGPELNFPRNITEYRDEKTLRAFIRNPASFRARSAMPGFPQLSDEQLDDGLAYLRWVKDRKTDARLPRP